MVRRRITPKMVGQDFESHFNDSGIGNSPGFEEDALFTDRVGPGTPYFQDYRPTCSSQDCSNCEIQISNECLLREREESLDQASRESCSFGLFLL